MGCLQLKVRNLNTLFSLQKERRILGRFLGSNEVIGCYGDCVSVDEGCSSTFFCWSMLLSPKGSLLNLMKDYGGRGPESHVRKYTQMLLKGLSCIYYNGHVHCDLKLANILVFPCRDHGVKGHHLKIADFGLAREPGEDDSDKLLHMYQYRGTPCYMSPESVQFVEITSALDIWSLGCIAVEMIKGRIAWGTWDSKELFNKLVRGNESPMIPENMPEKGKDFLRRCFERDHCERWSADKLLTHSFILDELLPPVETKTGELSSSHIDGVVLSVVNFVLC